jgi:hypothetical protein
MLGKPSVIAIGFVLLVTGCMQNGDRHSPTAVLDRDGPTVASQTVPTRASGPSDVQPKSVAERIARILETVKLVWPAPQRRSALHLPDADGAAGLVEGT